MTMQFSFHPGSLKRRCFAVLAIALALTVGGCAQQRIRDESQALLRDGQYERAITSLEAGLKDYPESALLRAGVLQARGEAMSRLVTEAATARSSGKLDDAEAILKRAAAFDTGGKRIDALLSDLTTERRQRKALVEAESLAANKQPEAALRVIADALKDSPRQSDLLALQRRLEVDARQNQVRAAQQGLTETRAISLDFRDASLRTILDVVTRNSGVNFILDKDIRPDTRVTVYLRSARVEDAIDLIVSTHQLAKKVIDGQTIFIYPNTPEKQREHQEQVIRVFYLASAEAKNAAAFLRSMLKIKDPYVDERSNMLAIREARENVELAERLIALYDTNEPEVLLELEVIEIRTNRLTDLGIQFPDSFSLTPLGPAGTTGGLTLANVRGITRDRIALSVGGVLVNLKREVGDFTTLANPRIRARNKEKAKVLVGDKVPVISATIAGAGGFASESVSYIDVGLKLDVEPTVYADDEVVIKISLEVSSIAGQVNTNSGSKAYQIGTRSASTLLRLRDGETQVLAGLISNEDRSSANRVPGLGDLPVMGRLFSSQRDENNRTELVLAITPRVLRNLRRPDANETELWVGTDALPRLRPVGGRPVSRADSGATAEGAVGSRSAMPPPPPSGTPRVDPAVPQQTTASTQWRGPAEVKVGDMFVATLELNTPTALRGAPMQLAFSKDKLALLDIEEGDFFRQGGAPTSFTKSIEAADGKARAGVLRNQAIGAPGQGTVLTVRLRALAAGQAQLSLVGFEPITLGESAPRVVLPQTLGVLVK